MMATIFATGAGSLIAILFGMVIAFWLGWKLRGMRDLATTKMRRLFLGN